MARQSSGTNMTVVDVAVLVGVLALLMSIVSPSIRHLRKKETAVLSQETMRTWAVAVRQFTDVDRNGLLPWTGTDRVAMNFPDQFKKPFEAAWWADTLPGFLGGRPYSELSILAKENPRNAAVPLPPQRTIWTDPLAVAPPEAPYESDGYPFFFCYVPNKWLAVSAETVKVVNAQGDLVDIPRLAMRRIDAPARTVLFVEKRAVQWEVPVDDPFYQSNAALGRAKCDWRRFAARHNDGAHLSFADGHVEWRDYQDVTTNSAGKRDASADFNRPDLLWNPLGPAR